MALKQTVTLFRSAWKMTWPFAAAKSNNLSCGQYTRIKKASDNLALLNLQQKSLAVTDPQLRDIKLPTAFLTSYKNVKSQSGKQERKESITSHTMLSQVFTRYTNSLSWLYFNQENIISCDQATTEESNEQLECGSVMKKRRKKIKLHKLKKKRRRDRFKVKRT
ncbi:uncharacterized protein TRIADDRAFT_57699 [Trichoplax adhaerens]|uniref:Ribosomal protein mS38 C-terminal domain-containing protein n=1 Tax=Trichoplax adhaerens TaxID=10228 RepID=B3S064_TRIAD|nr:predicted protein [Trichoplax adhaerens]EDV24335.1 predicted protein [Trichoplax adhaerens]|eukprot:XP_002113861.1 predicted protein [Trichoplax adhaerens]